MKSTHQKLVVLILKSATFLKHQTSDHLAVVSGAHKCKYAKSTNNTTASISDLFMGL